MRLPRGKLDLESAIDFIESFPDLDQQAIQPAINSGSIEFMTPRGSSSLLAILGNKHVGRKCAHITGTKGKGSTSTMLCSVLNELDGPAALFTSPHIQYYNERFRIGDCLVSDRELLDAIDKVAKALENRMSLDGELIARFHILIAVFFELIGQCRSEPQWQIIEVGMGGKNDPTNIFERKSLAVFTPIALEHASILGNSIESIARNKAGIITPGSTVIIAPQQSKKTSSIIQDIAIEHGCSVVDVAAEYNYSDLHMDEEGIYQEFRVDCPYRNGIYKTRLLGEHQAQNALTVMACIDAINEGYRSGDSIIENKVKSALESAWLPGRLDILNQDPFVIADGAHTKESAKVLKLSIDRLFHREKIILILAVNQDKDAPGILHALLDKSRNFHLILSQTSNKNSFPCQSLYELAIELLAKNELVGDGIKVDRFDTIEDSLSLGLQEYRNRELNSETLILVTGSLYAAGEARDYFAPN